MQELRTRKLHIFVDASNIMIGSQLVGNTNERDTSIRLRVDKLIEVVSRGRHIETGVVIGTTPERSSTFWNRWTDAGFAVHVFENVTDRSGKRGEQGVDDALQSMMFKDASKIFTPVRTLVLLTGDGNPNSGRVSFPEIVETAVHNNWNVEVWSWRASTHQIYKKLCVAYQGQVSVFNLDQYRSEVTFRGATGTTGTLPSSAEQHAAAHAKNVRNAFRASSKKIVLLNNILSDASKVSEQMQAHRLKTKELHEVAEEARKKASHDAMMADMSEVWLYSLSPVFAMDDSLSVRSCAVLSATALWKTRYHVNV
jgi:hypothetical protein